MNQDFYYTPVSEDEEELAGGFDRTGVDSGEFDDSRDFNEEDLSLGLIRLIGTEHDGYNQYEFVFTSKPDEFFGDGFEYKPAGLCNNLVPFEKYIDKVVMVKTLMNLDLIQDSGCFSMQDCMDGIVALAWENIDNVDVYPEYRAFFMFGDKYTLVEEKLAEKHVLI
jgi:hypothetical protein